MSVISVIGSLKYPLPKNINPGRMRGAEKQYDDGGLVEKEREAKRYRH
jgi:hypothetical protein